MTRYRELLTSPGVGYMVLAGIISRLPSSMIPLALPLVIVGKTGSYVSAGLVTAFFVIASGVSSPFRGRLVDRIGSTVVLVVTGSGQALALIAVVTVAGMTSNIGWLIVAAALAGLFTPPVTEIMRALWARLERQDLRNAAFAFESITIDVFYIVGPLLIAVLITLAPIGVTLITAAALCAIGTNLLALTPGAKRSPAAPKTVHWLGPLRSGAVRRLLPIAALVTGSLTAAELGIIAFTSAHQEKALAGVIISAMSICSIAGGVYWGTRVQPGSLRQQFTLLLVALTAGMALLAIAASILWLGVLSMLVGLALAPSITVQYTMMDAVAPAHEITESFSWIGTAGQAGEAAAVAIAGLFVTRLHDSGGFVVAAVLVGAAALFCAFLAPDAVQRSES